jgi:nicotinate phosphoribosyltransferase
MAICVNNIIQDMLNEYMSLTDLNIADLDAALATDFYELTMAAAYFRSGQSDRTAVFEGFVRKLPRNRSYMVAAGLEQVLHYITNLRFNDDQISYLQSLEGLCSAGDDFFEYLRRFRFTGDVWAVAEGTVLFPNEPYIRIEAPLIEAQILETYLLCMMNFQSLIATKASRIVNSARNREVVEFGSRRAHGPQAALLAARASYIGGCVGTSNALAGRRFGIPTFGTMAHSFVMNYEHELKAFQEFLKVFPNGFLLVDTYDTIAAVDRIVKAGIQTGGIRLDSGDLYDLSVKSRCILDNAGYKAAKIMASGDLNEYIIADLAQKAAPIDIFGVGTELATSRDDPAMNGVYKLVAIRTKEENNIRVFYKMKTSPGKKTYPGPKQVYRVVRDDLLISDVVALEDEPAPKESTSLLQKYLEQGRMIRKLPSLRETREFHREQVELLPSEFMTLSHTAESFPVLFSERLERIVQEFKHEQ